MLRDQAQDYRAGVIASVIANCNIGRDAEPFKPSDFFPSLKELEAEGQEGQGDALDDLMAFHAGLGGTVVMREADGTVVRTEDLEPPMPVKRQPIHE